MQDAQHDPCQFMRLHVSQVVRRNGAIRCRSGPGTFRQMLGNGAKARRRRSPLSAPEKSILNQSPASTVLFDAFDLFELELDRRGAAEDGHGDLDAALLEIQLLND